MNTPTETRTEKLKTFPYVIGGMSFIPLIGIVFGLIAIIWGLVTKKQGGKQLVIIGAVGISFTVISYAALSYFGTVQRGGIFDDLRVKLAQSELNSLVQAIEFYRLQYGSYPQSLKALQETLPKDSAVSVYDTTSMRAGSPPKYFYYERVGDDHYYLRGLGKDGQPFTSDDIVPQVSLTQNSKIGLLLNRKPDP